MNMSVITEAQRQEAVGFAQAMNENLRTSTGSGAEVAFGLSCGIGLIPVVGIILLLLALKVVSLIPGLMFLVIALLGLMGISMLLANLARSNAQKRIFRTEIDPEIVRFIDEQKINRQVFDTLASQALPPDAPLQAFLSPLTQDEADQSEHANFSKE
jgi:hypothetical protein